MATPKGMRAVQLTVSATDAVHVYSDSKQIWIQLRRNIPTESEIGSPSFKAALCLTPDTASKLGSELLKLAERNKGKLKAQASASRSDQAAKKPEKAKVEPENSKICPHCKIERTIENDGRQWCPKCGKYSVGRINRPKPIGTNDKRVKPTKKPPVLDLISSEQDLQ